MSVKPPALGGTSQALDVACGKKKKNARTTSGEIRINSQVSHSSGDAQLPGGHG